MSLVEAEAERRRKVQRMVADKVTDAMLTTPVADLSEGEAAMIQAVLNGPFRDELVARIVALGKP